MVLKEPAYKNFFDLLLVKFDRIILIFGTKANPGNIISTHSELFKTGKMKQIIHIMKIINKSIGIKIFASSLLS